MKKLFLFLLPLVLLFSCSSAINMTAKVRPYFSMPTESKINYDLNGAVGSADFSFDGKNSKILFTSGEELSGVEFTIADGKATAKLGDLVWDTSAEMLDSLSIIGKMFLLAAEQEYKAIPSNTTTSGATQTVVNTVEYENGCFEVSYLKENGKPIFLFYQNDGKSIKIDITEITIITEKKD